jgi:hypothetical protein
VFILLLLLPLLLLLFFAHSFSLACSPDAMGLGSGRQEPNHSPYLPPPVGRMHFTMDPFNLAQQVIGGPLAGSLVSWLSCCACLAIVAAFIIVLGPIIQIGFKLFNGVVAVGGVLGIGGWGTIVVLGVTMALLVGCMACLSTSRGKLVCARVCSGICSCCFPSIRLGD